MKNTKNVLEEDIAQGKIGPVEDASNELNTDANAMDFFDSSNISKNTLNAMDEAMKNVQSGIIYGPIDISKKKAK